MSDLTLSPEAADVLLRWLVAGVAKSAPSDPATQEAIQYVITGRAERRLAAFRSTPAARQPEDGLREALGNLVRHHELERVHGNTHIHPDKCEFVMQAERALRSTPVAPGGA